ncbi:MAG TPA: hypothetical protein VLC94_10160 [Candidatus Acidoferrum sp.]|nr:hypothetical protein [Candidatus Acidoferrum sp.]
MARTRTTKAVAQRIDLNYFKRATPFKRAKLWLAISAPALALLWIGWHFLLGDQRVYSSGQLSEAHAVLEKQCVACHVRQASGFSAKAADTACLACHDGPAHHPEMTARNAPKQGCAECHAEHRGRVRIAASVPNCVLCHADLKAAGPGSHFAKNIASFAHGHPEFAAVRDAAGGSARDPGMIKLNHALHMRAIRRGPTGPDVQLHCSDCHRPSASTDTKWNFGDEEYAAATVSYTAAETFAPGKSQGLPARRPWSDRQLMAPVKFANVCAGCHLLTFDKRFEDGVPHDRPEVIHEYLVRRFAKYITTHPEELRQTQDPRRNLAGRENIPAVRSVSGAQWVAERVATSEELLWHKTCAQCHTMSGSLLQDANLARWDGTRPKDGTSQSTSLAGLKMQASTGSLPSISAANITLQWLPHARFDHDAHTGFACTGCHQNALSSTEASDVLIPGIAVCQTCHASGPSYANVGCSECHTYHNWGQRKEVKPVFMLPTLKKGN